MKEHVDGRCDARGRRGRSLSEKDSWSVEKRADPEDMVSVK
jgi:hypothetical protein